MLIGQITARVAGTAWYASAIIGLRGEVHRLIGGTGAGNKGENERVWGEHCDGILWLDAKVDESISEILNTLGPRNASSAYKCESDGRREPTRPNRCNALGVLHPGGQWRCGRDGSKRHEEEMRAGSCATRLNSIPQAEAKRRTRGCL